MAIATNINSVRTITEDGELVSIVENLEDNEAWEIFEDANQNIEAGMIVQLINEEDNLVVAEQAA